MNAQTTPQQQRIAVVGSGMAGLVTAHLLQHDRHRRYAVEVFESGDTLSLDSASVSIPNAARTSSDRVDLPMRAFAGGFYSNLRSMYDYLGIQYQSQPFLFEFARSKMPYFAHASNLHKLPARPSGASCISYLCEVLYLAVCYVYFSLCCFFIAPRRGETLQAYLERTWTPERFVTYYVLPLISSVTTCPHNSLLAFPASDLTEYKRRTHRAPHFTVSEGVRAAQDRLAKGVECTLNAAITAVEPGEKGVRLSWKTLDGQLRTQTFDKVVLAVAPDVVGHVFEPLRHHMASIPTTLVESVVHTDTTVLNAGYQKAREAESTAQLIHLNTTTSGEHKTESHHIQPCGAIVTTCPFSAMSASHITHSAKFTRVLRSPQSQRIVNFVFGLDQQRHYGEEKAVPHLHGDWYTSTSQRTFRTTMILRTIKCLGLTAILWYAEPYFYPRFSYPHDLPIPVLYFSTLYFKALLLVTALAKVWTFGKLLRTDTTHATRPKTLAEACRDLLNLVLSEAGLTAGKEESPAPSRFLLDVGFGCGEQTIHLMSDKPVRPSDRLWWDEVDHKVLFERYVGITQDAAQCTYAQQRVRLERGREKRG
ncbi:hypothetical protein E8E13_010833 [Curvularia kusanoi]|uniref:Amine oxidase domain-containing protein n=1 Tax=Curvularia kusanoi TaxID=90978 RepID=A0A9P4TKC9_CURKU|nr:hypothetical protein E8E13_010833 [Curvularia kusanoi]